VRLIRSKGVGVYFVTQNPLDVPETVLGQLGNRVQHALRAFTPRDQKAVKATAETFRASPGLDVATAITELAVGEALVSLLQADGSPAPVARTLIRPPASRVGPLAADERKVLVETDAIGAKYDVAIDRESAEELIAAKRAEASAAAAEAQAQDAAAKAAAAQAKEDARRAKEEERARIAAEREAANNPLNRAIRSATRSASSAAGRAVANEVSKAVFGSKGGGGMLGQVVRGVLGGLFRG